MKNKLKRIILSVSFLIFTAGLASYFVFINLSQTRLQKVYTIPKEKPIQKSDATSFYEGKRIFQYRGCEACHGEKLEGLVYLDNPAIGKVITPNLTTGKGGIGIERTDDDLLRAIRHGIRPDGTPLLFMPSTEYYFLSESDLGKLIGYVRSVHPVDNEMPPSKLSLTGQIAMNITKEITFLPAELIPHQAPPPPAPEPGITPEYGEYLALSCKVCHGLTLSGGEIPGFPIEWPLAQNLTSGSEGRLPRWGEEGFIIIIRTGRYEERVLDPAYMPWKSYQHMTDDELRAVYTYLMSLPPVDFGNR